MKSSEAPGIRGWGWSTSIINCLFSFYLRWTILYSFLETRFQIIYIMKMFSLKCIYSSLVRLKNQDTGWWLLMFGFDLNIFIHSNPTWAVPRIILISFWLLHLFRTGWPRAPVNKSLIREFLEVECCKYLIMSEIIWDQTLEVILQNTGQLEHQGTRLETFWLRIDFFLDI